MKAAYRGGVRASTSPAKERYAVSDATVVKLLQPGSFSDPLTEVLRNGARALLAQAIEAEVAEFLAKHVDLKTATGLRRVVRHGHLPEREVMTGIGPVGVRQPRVRDRGAADDSGRIRFTPAILPPYARRSRSLEVLIPILYLKGISTGDFEEALAALLGKDAPGLSASTIARLKEIWLDEHEHWRKRDLSAKRYVYVWADGIYLQARLEDTKQCILVIIGATPEGKKELLGFTDGARESAQDWRELLLDLQNRGLAVAPELAVADGALGFWKALGELWPTTREQRCWVHKTANVLNKLPKSQQPKAKRSRSPTGSKLPQTRHPRNPKPPPPEPSGHHQNSAIAPPQAATPGFYQAGSRAVRLGCCRQHRASMRWTPNGQVHRTIKVVDS